MSKQLQDAYIVAATRTPIGKAPRGMFNKTRPDDLLVAAIQRRDGRRAEPGPGADRRRHHRLLVPGSGAGLQHRPPGGVLAGLPNTVGGVTVNRYCASGITALAMAADRIRVGEADVMIAGGVESMSMVPMMGHHPSINMDMFKDENVGLAYGMGLTAEKVATSGSVARRPGRLRPGIAPPRHRRAAGRPVQGRDHPGRNRHPHAEPGHRRDHVKRRTVDPTKARAPTPAWKAWPS
jgi:acetyl-CoA acyltransferase